LPLGLTKPNAALTPVLMLEELFKNIDYTVQIIPFFSFFIPQYYVSNE